MCTFSTSYYIFLCFKQFLLTLFSICSISLLWFAYETWLYMFSLLCLSVIFVFFFWIFIFFISVSFLNLQIKGNLQKSYNTVVSNVFPEPFESKWWHDVPSCMNVMFLQIRIVFYIITNTSVLLPSNSQIPLKFC